MFFFGPINYLPPNMEFLKLDNLYQTDLSLLSENIINVLDKKTILDMYDNHPNYYF